jgi:hypothetical protein
MGPELTVSDTSCGVSQALDQVSSADCLWHRFCDAKWPQVKDASWKSQYLKWLRARLRSFAVGQRTLAPRARALNT